MDALEPCGPPASLVAADYNWIVPPFNGHSSPPSYPNDNRFNLLFLGACIILAGQRSCQDGRYVVPMGSTSLIESAVREAALTWVEVEKIVDKTGHNPS